MNRRRLAVLAGAAALVTVAGVVAVQRLGAVEADRQIPTTQVTRGRVDVTVRTQGDLRAMRSAMIVAPSIAGTLQIVRVATPGSRIPAGETVVEFDVSEQEFNVEQSASELAEAEQEIQKLTRESAVSAAQDEVALLHARFEVRRAELDAGANELVSKIDAQKNLMALEEAKRRLTELEDDIRSRSATSRAGLAVLEEKRNKARLTKQTAERNIEMMRVRTPFEGLVVLKENMDAMGGILMVGMPLPEYHEGDSVNPGRVIAEVVDSTGVEILGKVSESDRSQINAGDRAEVVVDPVPGEQFPATVQSVAGMVSRRFFDSDSQRQFDAVFKLDRVDARLRPGVTAVVTVTAPPLENVLHVPREAVFEVDGKPVVYARKGREFVAHPVKLRFRNETRAVIEEIDSGTEVALVNPTTAANPRTRPAAGPAPSGR
jgi:multidrug efflux pump subunit AcrA (membrane-fusion protein)